MEIVTAARTRQLPDTAVLRTGIAGASRALWSATLALAVGLAGLPALLFTPLNHDVACVLYYARRMMAGDRLYRDFVDNNPPLVFYLGIPIEALSQWTGLLETQALACVLIALTLAVVWLSARVLRLDARQSVAVRCTLLLSCIAAALLLPARDFGQREHFAFLLLIPYSLLCAVRAERLEGVNRVTALLVAAAASVGFGLKPHFGIVLLALLAYVVWSRRDWRAVVTLENVGIATGLGLYVAFVLLWTPEYVTAMVPIAVRHYGAYTVSPWLLLTEGDASLFVLGLAPLVAFAAFITGSRDAARVVRPLALVSLAFFAVFLVQATPYRYHVLPSLAFYVLALAGAIAAFAHTLFVGRTDSRSPRDLVRLVMRTVVLMACVTPGVVIGVGVFDSYQGDRMNLRAGVRSPLVGVLVDVVHAAAANQPIFVLSSSVNPAFPLVNLSETRWPYHYNCLWLLPAYYRNDQNAAVATYRPPAAQDPGERAFFDAVVADLQRTPPTVLIVDRSRFKQGFGLVAFDFVQYFSQSPAFAALFREYGVIARIGPYEVYKRGVTPHNTGS
jgi:hypothetical protein